jgi:AcrR family transcriptional regulator
MSTPLTTRERILSESLSQFNRLGVESVSTNHLAQALGMSPGNLYYHFENKEAIIRELFDQMSKRIDLLWTVETAAAPKIFFKNSVQLFWEFRFFHRELYPLRRKDRSLSRKWHQHLERSVATLIEVIKYWSDKKWMRMPRSDSECRTLAMSMVITAGAYLQFYEGADRRAHTQAMDDAVSALLFLISPYQSTRSEESKTP